MSNALRQTQRSYQAQLTALDQNDKLHNDAITANAAKRKDIQAAKTVVDEAVAKLPAEPKPAKPASTKSAK